MKWLYRSWALVVSVGFVFLFFTDLTHYYGTFFVLVVCVLLFISMVFKSTHAKYIGTEKIRIIFMS